MNTWLFLEHAAHSPAWNMACDEWLLKHATVFAKPLLRTYQWDRPSITIGYFQPYPKNINAHVVVRRPTGGALVIHDSDLTFSVVLPPNHDWCKSPICDRYRKIHERVAKVFELRGVNSKVAIECDQTAPMLSIGSRWALVAPRRHPCERKSTEEKIDTTFRPSGRAKEGVECFAKISKYDVIINNKKVAGGAQRITKEGLLHQGSIQDGDQPTVSSEELRIAWEKSGSSFEPLILTTEQNNQITQLARDKFETSKWNHLDFSLK